MASPENSTTQDTGPTSGVQGKGQREIIEGRLRRRHTDGQDHEGCRTSSTNGGSPVGREEKATRRTCGAEMGRAREGVPNHGLLSRAGLTQESSHPIAQVAVELAIIREEQERGTEAQRRWSPLSATPSPPVEKEGEKEADQDKDLYEDSSTARPERDITPAPERAPAIANPTQPNPTILDHPRPIPAPVTTSQQPEQIPKGPKGACHGCRKRGRTAQESFNNREKERAESGDHQERPFYKLQERTPRGGLGQPKGKGPARGQEQEPRKGRVEFYKARPVRSAQQPK